MAGSPASAEFSPELFLRLCVSVAFLEATL